MSLAHGLVKIAARVRQRAPMSEQDRYNAFRNKLSGLGVQELPTMDQYRSYSQWRVNQPKGRGGYSRWLNSVNQGAPSVRPAAAPMNKRMSMTVQRQSSPAAAYIRRGGQVNAQAVQGWNEQAATRLANYRTKGGMRPGSNFRRDYDIVMSNPHIKEQHKQAWRDYADQLRAHDQAMAQIRAEAEIRARQPKRPMVTTTTGAGARIHSYA